MEHAHGFLRALCIGIRRNSDLSLTICVSVIPSEPNERNLLCRQAVLREKSPVRPPSNVVLAMPLNKCLDDVGQLVDPVGRADDHLPRRHQTYTQSVFKSVCEALLLGRDKVLLTSLYPPAFHLSWSSSIESVSDGGYDREGSQPPQHI